MPRSALARVGLALAIAALAAGRAAADPGDAIARARAFAKSSQYDQAVKALEGPLAANPRDFAANELRGFCLMKLFRFDEACLAFERGDATDRYHFVNYGFCLRKAGRLIEAEKAFASAQFVLGPGDSWAAYCRTQLEDLAPLAKKRVVLALAQADDQAIAILNGAPCARARGGGEAGVALDDLLRPGKNELRVLCVNTQGEWAHRVRLYVDGKEVFAAAAGRASPGGGAFDGDETIGVTAEVRLELTRDPEKGPAFAGGRSAVDFAEAARRLYEADELWRNRRRNEAIALLDESARRFPLLDCFPKRMAACYDEAAAAVPVTAANQARIARLRAAAREARVRWLEVRKKVAALAPDDIGALLGLAGASAQAGDYAEAEKAWRRVIALDPSRIEAFVGLADALVRAKRPGEALPYADEAVARAPEWADAYFARGDALLEVGDAQGAIAAFLRAIDCDPSQAEWIRGKIALAANRGGANEAAIEAARAAAAARPADAAAAKALGDALFRGMRYDEALAAFGRAVEIDPKIEGAWAMAGLAAELEGDLARAEAAYARAAGDGPLAALARRRLARLRWFARVEDGPEGAVTLPGKVPVDFAAGEERAKARFSAALAAIEKARPALAVGIRALPPLRDGSLSEKDARAVERIAALVAAGRGEEERLGLALVERQVGRPAGRRIAIDGRLDDWGPGECVASGAPGTRLRGLYATVDGGDLFIAWQIDGGGAPGADTACWAQVHAQRPDRPWLGVGIGSGGAVVLRVAPDGGREERRGAESRVEWRAGPDGVEARVPLDWLPGERRLRIEGYTWSERARRRIETLGEGEPPVPVADGYAPALLALFALAQEADIAAQGRVALAIALASSEYWALGDGRAQAAVRADDRRTLALAREIEAWQKTAGLPPLGEQPLAALLFWANRSVQWRPADAADYRRAAIAPATLEAMLAFARERRFAEGGTAGTVERCERWLADPLRWQYTSAEAVARGLRARRGEAATFDEDERRDLNKFVREVACDGLRISTDGEFRPDLQFDYLLAADALVGHCGNLAQETVEFCRAMGIPATIVQGLEERSKLYPSPHAFAVYWDGAARAWRSVQGKSYRGERPLALYWFLPGGVAPPPEARPTGAGGYWFPVRTTYEAAGAAFRDGEGATWWGSWLGQLARER